MSGVVAVIPSRIGSTRLPEKPLIDISGLPLVAHVVERTRRAALVDTVLVATDDARIADIAEGHGATAVVCSDRPRNGTERVAAVAADLDCDVVVHVNGDEALVSPPDIDRGVRALRRSDAGASLLVQGLMRPGDRTVVKTVMDQHGHVLYLSRCDIPGCGSAGGTTLNKAVFVVCYRPPSLHAYRRADPTPLELAEDINELRLLELGHRVTTASALGRTRSVDVATDLAFVRQAMPSDPWFEQYARA